MEMSLFNKDGATWTRFKVLAKNKLNWFTYLCVKYGIDVLKPVKENNKFIYFEKEGNWLNG